MSRFVRAMDLLYLVCVWISGMSLLIMSVVIPWGVYTRYVLNTGSSWPEPLAILLMVLFTFLAAAACYRSESHIAVKLLTDRLPERMRRLGERVVDVLMVLLALFMVIWGTELVIVTWHQVIAEFPFLSVGITYLPLPVGSAITLLFIVERMIAGSQAGRAAVDFDGSHAAGHGHGGGDDDSDRPDRRLLADNTN